MTLDLIFLFIKDCHNFPSVQVFHSLTILCKNAVVYRILWIFLFLYILILIVFTMCLQILLLLFLLYQLFKCFSGLEALRTCNITTQNPLFLYGYEQIKDS